NMNDDHKLKILDGRSDAAQETRENRANKLKIGDYYLYKWDNLNWTIERDGNIGYFSDLEQAILSIPKKLIITAKYSDFVTLLEEIRKFKKELKDFLWIHLPELKKMVSS
ncbi:MAG: hypothetical protein AABY22_03445, partial [Nanoarchaeota archaeon]